MDIGNKKNKPRCKLCGSTNVARHGEVKGVQRYRCNDGGRTYLDNDNLPDMKTPQEVIESAINIYYEGLSLNKIRRHLDLTHNVSPSVSTIYSWLTRYSEVAIKGAKAYTPDVGDVWIADEAMLKIRARNVWFWDLIDVKTRFLLAYHISIKRTTADALTLMKLAEQRADKVPKVVFIDKLQAYLDGVELAFGSDVKHIPSKGFVAPMNTSLIEPFHGTVKDRIKVMLGLRNLESARLFMDGWLIHYNFFRPHQTLKGKTPAEKAGISFHFKDWGDVITSQHMSVRENAGE